MTESPNFWIFFIPFHFCLQTYHVSLYFPSNILSSCIWYYILLKAESKINILFPKDLPSMGPTFQAVRTSSFTRCCYCLQFNATFFRFVKDSYVPHVKIKISRWQINLKILKKKKNYQEAFPSYWNIIQNKCLCLSGASPWIIGLGSFLPTLPSPLDHLHEDGGGRSTGNHTW